MAHFKLDIPGPHKGQMKLLQGRKKYNVAAMGRRFGKTLFGTTLTVDPVMRGENVAWIAPVFRLLVEPWELLKKQYAPLIEKSNESQKMLWLKTGSRIDGWSAESYTNIRSNHYALAIVDEAAWIPDLQDMWDSTLGPTLLDNDGECWFFSTPKGRNYFHRLYKRAGTQDFPRWASFTARTIDNPTLKNAKAFLDEKRKSVPERTYLQEYEAQFLDDSNAVFRRVYEACRSVLLDEPKHNRTYVAGLDWARNNDYTVLTCMDAETQEVVYLDRFTDVAYEVQLSRIQGFVDKFQPCSILAESNSIGQPLIEQMQGMGMPVQSFTTTNATKRQIIEELILDFEQKNISIPAQDQADSEVLVGELLAYEQKTTASGIVTYNAPTGEHDDTVMSLAIANHAAKRSVVSVIDGLY